MNISDRVTYELVDRVARIELAHGQAANSLDQPMGEALHEAAHLAKRAAGQGDARLVVISAQGRMFSVGGDLAEFARADDRGVQVKATADALHAALRTIRSVAAPVVSVIQGTAAGGGLGFALAGDIVIAAAEAKLVMAYTASGLTPDCGLTWLIPNRLTWPQAMDLALTNRVLTGAEAADWGLVSRVVAGDELPDAVNAVVSLLRAGASDAYGDTKRLMLESRDRTMAEQMDHEATTIARLIVQPDGVEGIDAFLGKRQPAYR